MGMFWLCHSKQKYWKLGFCENIYWTLWFYSVFQQKWRIMHIFACSSALLEHCKGLNFPIFKIILFFILYLICLQSSNFAVLEPKTIQYITYEIEQHFPFGRLRGITSQHRSSKSEFYTKYQKFHKKPRKTPRRTTPAGKTVEKHIWIICLPHIKDISDLVENVPEHQNRFMIRGNNETMGCIAWFTSLMKKNVLAQ